MELDIKEKIAMCHRITTHCKSRHDHFHFISTALYIFSILALLMIPVLCINAMSVLWLEVLMFFLLFITFFTGYKFYRQKQQYYFNQLGKISNIRNYLTGNTLKEAELMQIKKILNNDFIRYELRS